MVFGIITAYAISVYHH